MFVYNTTYQLEDNLVKEWTSWMKNKFIPVMKETGIITNSFFSKIIVDHEGNNYSLQLFFKNETDADKYIYEYAPRIDAVFKAKYKESILTFSIKLEEV